MDQPDTQAATSATTFEGYHKGLGNRQVQMIAIGGAIGVGLFLGSGGRLQSIGPALIFAYLICGVAGFFVMRAMGELVMYKPAAGSFVTYAREFIGPWAGFVSGWLYWLNWAFTGIAEITAVGTYVSRWLPDLPHWITALVALGVLLAVNLISVKIFGEMEFWFSLLKVLAIVVFLIVGIVLVAGSFDVGGQPASVSNLTMHGGMFPNGFAVALISLQAVIFAYSAIEMVGITAGEATEPHKVIPKAVNAVVWRIALFYCGSVLLLVMLLPWTSYNGDSSPFVVVFSKLGVPGAADLMNVVVLTAALSSCNSGLYSTGRVLRALADRHEAPKFTAKMSKTQVPAGGILLTAGFYLLGVVLNYLVPKEAFDIATEIAGVGVVVTWMTFLYAQLRFRSAALRGEVTRPSFRMPGSPWTNYIALAFLVMVLVLLGFSDELSSRIAFYAIPGLAVILGVGWLFVRERSLAAAAAEGDRGGPPGGGGGRTPTSVG